MRLFLFILFSIIITYNGFSQDRIKLKIVDRSSNIGLAYCNISYIGTRKGNISNSEGYFFINKNGEYDSLRFYYIGYKSITIALNDINDGDIIKLEETQVFLSAITVHADNEYLYDLVNKVRKNLLKNKKSYSAKVYYGIETQTKETPLELLECFYNGEINGEHIKRLTYKNGRVGLASVDGNYFESFNSAKAISKINIIHKSDIYPSLPFQFNKRKLKKLFKLKAYTSSNKILKIEFLPYDSMGYFSGTIWINETNNKLEKLELTAHNTTKHPFLPIHNTDKISDVSIKLVKSYNTNEQLSTIDHIYFEYSLVYKSVRGKSMGIANDKSRIIERNISSKGIIRVYDYNNTFIIPYFNYPDNIYYGDYYKMSFIPYNKVFWENNHSIALNRDQQKKLNFFASKGKLVNYREGNYGDSFIIRNSNIGKEKHRHFGFYYSFWNKNKRITIKNDLKQNKLYEPEKDGLIIKRDLYNIEAQLFLDITRVKDSLYFNTYSVFDSYKTFYRLQTSNITNAFINIYFDLYEIQRRELQSKLEEKNWSLNEADSIYKQNIISINKIAKKYIKDVQMGNNAVELEKWNIYIFNNLGINNLKLITNDTKN